MGVIRGCIGGSRQVLSLALGIVGAEDPNGVKGVGLTVPRDTGQPRFRIPWFDIGGVFFLGVPVVIRSADAHSPTISGPSSVAGIRSGT